MREPREFISEECPDNWWVVIQQGNLREWQERLDELRKDLDRLLEDI